MITRHLFWILAAVLVTGGPRFAAAADRVVAANYPPLMIADAVEKPGYAVEVLREAALRAGREVEITYLPFERAIHALKTEDATLMPALFHGKPDAEKFLWLEEIHTARLTFATVGAAVNDLETARGLTAIVLEAGTTGDALLTKLGFTNLVRVHAPESSAQMLAAGRADAWILTEGLMQQVWDGLALGNGPTFGETVHEVATCLVASATLPKEMAGAYRDAVSEMRKDGTLSALQAAYGLK